MRTQSVPKSSCKDSWASHWCIQLFRERLSHKRGEAYATMSKVIMGNKDFTVPLLELKVFKRVEGNSSNPCVHNFSFLLARQRETQSMSTKLLLPIMPIGIVAYTFTLLLDNLCRNSCMWQALNTERSYITRLRCTACQSQIPTDDQCSHLIGLFNKV